MRGYVKDPTGAVLPEAKVTVASPTAPTPFTVVSDMEGYYRLLELPPGEYELTAELPSFANDETGFDANRIGGLRGLGLINMRERARQLNGTFELDSEPGRGTTVRVTIPFRPAV